MINITNCPFCNKKLLKDCGGAHYCANRSCAYVFSVSDVTHVITISMYRITEFECTIDGKNVKVVYYRNNKSDDIYHRDEFIIDKDINYIDLVNKLLNIYSKLKELL